MLQKSKLFTNKLSTKISLKVVSLVAVLLAVALIAMLYFSRKTVREEAILEAEQTLDGTVEHIDEVLLSVEQSTGNMYYNMYSHIDNPEMMYVYSRRLVESNPYIAGCAIAFHRSATGSAIVRSETFGNKPYNQQVWYTEPMKTGTPCWTDPLEDLDPNDEAITTYCLPIYGAEGERIGVVGVDVTINMLSRIILSAKPSENSYSILLGTDGSYLVHPDISRRLNETVYTQLEQGADPSVKEAADAMMAGQKGYKRIKKDGKDCYVFYKPFVRNVVKGRYQGDMGWSVGVVYPEDDIFGAYNRLLSYVLLFLTKSAHRIASGHYDEPIPDSHQHDEIGQLQNHFQQMQLTLAKHVDELEKLNVELKRQGESLRVAYHQAQAADRLKISFLHNMTNQMLSPVQLISEQVDHLWHLETMKPEDVDVMADDIQKQGEVITDLLNHLLELSKETMGKEGYHG